MPAESVNVKTRFSRSLLLGASLVAVVPVALLLKSRWSGSPNTDSSDAGSTRGTLLEKPETKVNVEAVRPQAEDIAKELADAESIAEPTQRRLARATVLADWITRDYPSALRYMRDHGFEDLYLPGIAALIAARASVDDLVEVASHATMTTDALLALGQDLDPAKLAALADATDRIDVNKQSEAASAIAVLTASRNLDSAIRYAAGLSEPSAKAAAYAGIIDELADSNNTSEAAALWESLSPEIRASDDVLFAHGKALQSLDPMGALESLSAIQDNDTRSLALVAFSRRVEAQSPAAAIQAMALSGMNAQAVDTHVARILKTWTTLDAYAAREYIGSATWMSDTQRAAWLAIVDTAETSPPSDEP